MTNSAWQSIWLSYRVRSPSTQPIQNLGMTITVIVIPKLQYPYDIHIHCHTHLSSSSSSLHTHSRIYTRFLHWVFQVFSLKTCWLLDSSINLLVGFDFSHVLSRYSAEISRNFKPSYSICKLVYTRFLPEFELGSVWCTNPVGHHLHFEVIHWFRVWIFGIWSALGFRFLSCSCGFKTSFGYFA